jgi:aryl-alcohol dehydrogenase
MKITAALSRDPDSDFSIEEIEISPPRSGEALVRLVGSGVCRTDLIVKSRFPADAGAVVLGHEGAGVVEEVGPGVVDVRVGDHVLMSYGSCGECASCRSGSTTYCASFAVLNKPGLRPDGSSPLTSGGVNVVGRFFGQSSFASYAVVDERNLVVVDHDIDLVAMAPLGCGFQTGAGAVLNVLDPGSDSHFVVFGAGGVGLAALMAAAGSGVRDIIAVDVHASRRDLATRLGATAVIDPGDGDVVESIRSITSGGASHSLDTTGVPSVINDAMSALAPLGTLVVVGAGPAQLPLDVQDVIASGKTLRGCIEGDAVPREFLPRLIEMYQDGRFPLDELVSRYPASEINRAVEDFTSGAAVKPVLVY